MGKLTDVNGIYRLNAKQERKRKQKERRKKREQVFEYFANKLNKNLPKSEKWFMDYYKYFEDVCDLQNDPIDKYIVDILNRKYMYAIEIDGSWHDQDWVKRKDKVKSARIKFLGYKLFRVRHNNMDDLKACIRGVLARRGITTYKQKIIKDGIVILDLDFTDIKPDMNYKSKPKPQTPLTRTKAPIISKPKTILRKKS